MKAWIVMGNAYPEAVFRIADRAEKYAALMKRRDEATPGKKAGIYWRAVEVELDPRDWPEDPAHPLCAACGRRVFSPCNDMAGYKMEGPWDSLCEGFLFPERDYRGADAD